MSRSVEQAFFGWLILLASRLRFAGAAVFLFSLFWLQMCSAVPAHARSYQVGSEGQNRLVAVLSDGEPLAGQLENSFLESAPNHLASADGFSGRADYRQRGALVLEVGNEGDFYFSVLVAQDHGLSFAQSQRCQSNIVRVNGAECSGVNTDQFSADGFGFLRGKLAYCRVCFLGKHHGAIVAQQHGARNTTTGGTSPGTIALHGKPTEEAGDFYLSVLVTQDHSVSPQSFLKGRYLFGWLPFSEWNFKGSPVSGGMFKVREHLTARVFSPGSIRRLLMVIVSPDADTVRMIDQSADWSLAKRATGIVAQQPWHGIQCTSTALSGLSTTALHANGGLSKGLSSISTRGFLGWMMDQSKHG